MLNCNVLPLDERSIRFLEYTSVFRAQSKVQGPMSKVEEKRVSGSCSLPSTFDLRLLTCDFVNLRKVIDVTAFKNHFFNPCLEKMVPQKVKLMKDAEI